MHDLHISNDPPPLESTHSSNLSCSVEQDDDDDDNAASLTCPSAIMTSGVSRSALLSGTNALTTTVFCCEPFEFGSCSKQS